MKLEIQDVSKSFQGKIALSHVSLSVQSGELLCLLGPSGAGKTTLIRLITGAIRADGGEIKIEGKRIPAMSILGQMGFMPQNDALYTDISGLDNVKFFGRLYGMRGNVLNRRAAEILRLMGLEEEQNKLVAHYSGGMKKRLSLAIALLHKPEILVLDEPTVGIDPVLRQAIWQEFFTLKNKGVTILVSTHVMDEAAKCETAALLYNGKLIAHGTVPELLNRTPNGNVEELFFMVEEDAL